jgi:hypothetical protein
MPSTFAFLHKCSEADCFQATPTPLISTQYEEIPQNDMSFNEPIFIKQSHNN